MDTATKTERKTTSLEDLNGHSIQRVFSDIVDSLKETGGAVAFRRVGGPTALSNEKVALQAVVQCVFVPEVNRFVLKAKEEDGWATRAAYSQGREELAALDFIREVFEAEGRDA